MDPATRARPDDALEGRARHRPLRLTGLCVLALALGAVIALRNPTPLHVPAFLYEDGPVFYVQAHESGWKALITPYAGYHHLLLRLVAAPAQWVPFHVGALVFAWVSLLATWGVALWMLALRLPWVVRIAMAVSVGFIPTYPGHYNHLTNLAWILGLLWPAWWMQAVPAVRIHRWSIWLVGALLALTGPLGLLAAPLFVVRYLRTRETFWRSCLLFWAVPLAIQAATLATHPVVRGVFAEPGAGDYLGQLARGWLQPLTGSASFTAVVLLVAVGFLVWQRDRRDLWLLGLFMIGMLAAGYWRSRHDLGSVSLYGSSGRYLIVPSMVAVWLIVAAASSHEGRGRVGVRVIGVIVAVWIAGLSVWKHPRNPGYIPSPPLETFAGPVARGEPVTVRLPFGWKMDLNTSSRATGSP